MYIQDQMYSINVKKVQEIDCLCLSQNYREGGVSDSLREGGVVKINDHRQEFLQESSAEGAPLLGQCVVMRV